MKKILLLTFLITMLSCGKDEPEVEYPLMGTKWETSLSGYKMTMEFRTRSSGAFIVAMENVSSETGFDYEVKGNNIYIEPYSSSMHAYVGTFSVSKMNLKSGDETFTFIKIK